MEQLLQITPPANEPVMLSDLKSMLRLEITADDTLAQSMLVAARIECERLIQRSFCTQTWTMTLDKFPVHNIDEYTGHPFTAMQFALVNKNLYPFFNQTIDLPRGPIQAITSVQYVDAASGTLLTLDPSRYYVATTSPGRLEPAYGTTWPIPRFQAGSVIVTYTAGYSVDGASVPENVKHAIKLLASHYYENRSEDAPVPRAVQNLLLNEEPGAYLAL